jgi:hypothetical protein
MGPPTGRQTRAPTRSSFTMPSRSSRDRERAPAVSPRVPVAMVVFSLLSRSALAAESKWIPDSGFGFNDYKFGTTRIVQCASGVPTTTQIAYNTYGRESSVTTAPKSWVSFQDHSVSLVPINASESTSGWFAPQTGFSSTNWGGNVGDLMAQGHMTWYGDKDGDEQQGTNAVRSGMSYGYISYTPKQVENLTLGENQFLVSAGGNTAYYLNGCPNYAPGNTSANMNYTCPRVPVKPGSYKFSIMGMLFGSMINSAHNASYPNYTESSSAHYRDLAQYKSLVLTTTLDVTNVGNASAKSAWVEFRNGTTVNFTDLTNTTDIAGTSLHFVSPGSGEDEIIMKFSDYYSTGNYTRDTAAIVTEFGAIPCDMSGGMDACVRDNTGFGNSPDSFPMGGNVAVKKMGKGGMDALPNIDCGNGAGYPTASYSSACDVTSYAGATESPASTAEELAVAAGAPKLEVTEVRPVRVYMRPHGGCSGRPASPAANDPTGTLGTTWVNAPKDCPAWYLASDVSDASKWNSRGGFNNIPANTMIDCEAGDLKCYLIDIHFDLVYSDGTRTVLGNPENDAGDANYGWAKGSFFMYDPEIGTGDAVSGSVNDASTDAENASTDAESSTPSTDGESPATSTDGESPATSTDGESSAAPTVATSAKALVLAALGALLL